MVSLLPYMGKIDFKSLPFHLKQWFVFHTLFKLRKLSKIFKSSLLLYAGNGISAKAPPVATNAAP